MNRDIAQIDGACHCGMVRFHVTLSHGLHTAHRCTCSCCCMRGAVAVSANLDGSDPTQYGVNHPADNFGMPRFVPAE